MALINNILIAAVGGQGALLAARVLGHYANELGLEVKVSEIHGMSQRGGSVVTHVRFGVDVRSPVIEAGTADVLLAFELLEAARYACMLKPGGLLLLDTQRILPLPVLAGTAVYPADLLERLMELPITTIVVDALAEAQAIGNAKTVNTILLGAFAKRSGSEVAPWHRAIALSVRDAHRAINLAAFDRGYVMVSAPTRPAPKPHEKHPGERI